MQGSSTPSRHQLRFYSKPHPPHLVLDFEDVDRDDGFIRVASREQVAAALTFAREQATGSLLIHCYHGVGRSAAIALAVLADRLGPGSEDEAMNQLLTSTSSFTNSLADRDQLIGEVIDNLNETLGTLNDDKENFTVEQPLATIRPANLTPSDLAERWGVTVGHLANCRSHDTPM